MSLSRAGYFRFGPYTVELRAHILTRNGSRVPIQEQPFQILLALLESPGQVITREDLRRRLWGEETFVDFDQSMNSAVRRLRATLEDNPRKPAYIETIPRIGFRFRAEVNFQEPPVELARPERRARPRTGSWAPDILMPLLVGAASRVQLTLSAAAVFALAMLLGLSFAAPKRLQSLHLTGPANPETAKAASPTPDFAAESNFTAADISADSAPAFDGCKPGASGCAAVSASFAPKTQPWAGLGALLLDKKTVRPASPAFHSKPVDMANLEGRYFLSLRNEEGFARATEAFHRALQIDANSTSALVGLAQVDILFSMDGNDAARHTAEAMNFAERALQLDPNLASAYAALAAAHVVKEWNWTAASTEFQKAIALDPNDSLSHLWYAMFVLVPEKKYTEAEQQARRAIELDPFSLIAQTDLGWIYFNEGRRNEALEQYSVVLQMNSSFVPARFRIAQLLELEGRHKQAVRFEPSDRVLAGRLRNVAAAREPGPSASADPCSEVSIALSNVVGDPIPLLRSAMEKHCVALIYMNQEPGFADLQKDPHFAELVHSLNLPEQ
jgi:DNA-binding winged helix-turn-helix (wHTH) protein/tetratricopeptide (TPR) repeat protein